jgi:hypothetical protein
MAQQIDEKSGLRIIWMTEAVVEYGHGPDWFRRRIRDGRIRTAPQPGTSRVYLVVEDVEREHVKGEND